MTIVAFLNELMRKRKKLPSQLAADIGVSHATMHRWLTGKDVPSTTSCRLLAEYAGVPLQEVLAASGHMPVTGESPADTWPEFRRYAEEKYPEELDDDFITVIEDLIERRRQKRLAETKSRRRRSRQV